MPADAQNDTPATAVDEGAETKDLSEDATYPKRPDESIGQWLARQPLGRRYESSTGM